MTRKTMPKKALRFDKRDRNAWLGKVLTDDNFSQKDVRIAVMRADQAHLDETRGVKLVRHIPAIVHKNLGKENFNVTRSHVQCVYRKLHNRGYLRNTKKDKNYEYYFMDTTK